MIVDAWLTKQIRPPTTPGKSVLVLCRTTATANTVRAWAARRKGVCGLEIATPRSLASQFDGPWLAPSPPSESTLPDTPFADRIRTRPGLVALAKSHVNEFRMSRAADPSVRAPAWLETLADSPWHKDNALPLRLLELARNHTGRGHQVHLTASHRWDRVVPIGFQGPLEPWTRAVLEALVRTPNTEMGPLTRPESAVGVPDTAAEARHAACHVRGVSDALILVQHSATAARIHRALERNGIASAWRPTAELERHTLASVIRRCVPWFSGHHDPPLRAVDLHFVLRHPMLGQRLPPPAESWLRNRLEALGEDPERTRLSGRGLASAIRRARHLDAPLSRWIAELEALGARTDEAGTPARSARLLARLKVLAASIRGQSFQGVFESDAPEEANDWGDFDALVANLIGEYDVNTLPPISDPGTLGALRRFLLSCRVRSGDDPASLRILGALRRGSERPATRLEALQLLRGTVDRGEVRPGVEILHYEEYDGRPSSTLVLCDVHDQGVAARPRPDPLLSDVQIEALGGLPGRARVEFRLSQLERAAAMATHVIPLVCERDVMGRALVPPVQLGLSIEPSRSAPYGLSVDGIPETAAMRVLEPVKAAELRAPATEDPRLQHYAVQATAEWCRSGRGPIAAPPKVQHTHGRATLAHLLVRRPTWVSWVRPWLGDATDVPEAALPEAEYSVSRFFRPVSHCLYQAFAKTVLRVKPPETVAEELDAREIGNAVHDALEQVALHGSWRHSGEAAGARESFREVLSEETTRAFARARSTFGALSTARKAATEGLESRWRTHWERYVRSRIEPGREGWPSPSEAEPLIFAHRFLDRATTTLLELARQAEVETRAEFLVKIWVKEVARIAARGGDPRNMGDRNLLDPNGRGGLPSAWLPVARAMLEHPHFHDVVDLWRRAEWLSLAIEAPTLAAVAELPFGSSEGQATAGTLHHTQPARIGPISIRLGEEDVQVHGYIDRVSVVGWTPDVRGEGLPPRWLRVVDYKTSRSAPNEKQGRKELYELIEPQLVVYALVVEQAKKQGKLPDPFDTAEMATIGWDHLRATNADRQLDRALDRYLIDPQTLHVLARALGSLVGKARRGEWWLSPRKDTCPVVSGWKHDYCDYVGACRLRALDVEGP